MKDAGGRLWCLQGIVLAGHSTGCQDVVRFITKEGHENIVGAILQAAVRWAVYPVGNVFPC